MAIAITVNRVDQGLNSTYVYGTLAFSGSYPTGGDTLNLAGLSGPGGAIVDVASLPHSIAVWGAASFGYGVPAPISTYTLSTIKLKITTASGTELAAGAYPAGVTGDQVFFECAFPANQ
jgi:hypothetical protein